MISMTFFTVCDAAWRKQGDTEVENALGNANRTQLSASRASPHGYAQMYGPMLARESTAMITPSLKMNPSVVVPWLGLTRSTASFSKPSSCGARVEKNSGVPRRPSASKQMKVRGVSPHVCHRWKRELHLEAIKRVAEPARGRDKRREVLLCTSGTLKTEWSCFLQMKVCHLSAPAAAAACAAGACGRRSVSSRRIAFLLCVWRVARCS